MPNITIIGSGVSGLSSALNLQLAGYDVRILTRDLPQATTSVAAGAIWSGADLEGRQRQWARVTLARFLRLAEQAGSGVTLQRMREVFPQPAPRLWYQALLPFCERIPARDLPPGLADGFLLDVPMVAPPLYLQNLQDQFVAAGGTIEMRTVETLDELSGEARLLVNCTGVGAREVAKDEAVYPIRGQTLLIEAPQIAVGYGYMDNSKVNHIFPRGDGVLIGGIKIPHDRNMQIDAQVSADIIERCSRIEPAVADAKVLRQFVGLRPGRHQVRLEVERLSSARAVIHNYGHAAVGFTLSWGCAQEVTDLAQSVLS